jgi:cytoskeleton protein RodZ
MSGVAKDDTNPTPPAEGETPSVGVEAHPPVEAPSTHDAGQDSDGRHSRRAAPHLRVVTDNDLLPAPIQRIGAVIRSARENQGLTLEQVSKDTRIHLSHLRAIEDMTPSLLGAPVYAKGYIRNYARHLKLDPDATLARYLSECAILADPEKQEIAPPMSARKLPAAVPVLGLLVVALVGAGGAVMLMSNDPAAPAAKPTETASAAAGAAAPVAAATPAAQAPALRLVAVKRARVEVRGADGTKFVARFFSPGESYSPRVDAGWTVTTDDGSAFEWRLGDASLGLLAETGPVYAQSVDVALTRTPIVVETPEPVLPAPSEAEANAVVAPPANAAPPKPRPAKPKPEAAPAEPAPPVIGTAPVPMPNTATPAAEADPSLAAYPSVN